MSRAQNGTLPLVELALTSPMRSTMPTNDNPSTPGQRKETAVPAASLPITASVCLLPALSALHLETCHPAPRNRAVLLSQEVSPESRDEGLPLQALC